MASNSGTLADEDGSFEDWIEIQNVSPATVNLFDWSLTDNPGNLTKWQFPATNLPSGGFLVIFASNKDRDTVGEPLHANFKLSAAGEYLALVDPTGTNIVSEFSPAYPGQVQDVSYGFGLTASNVTLVASSDLGQVLVPSVANGGSTLFYSWTGLAANEPFDTTAWTSGTTGIGFNAGGVGDIGLNVQSGMLDQNASAFIRIPFVLSNPEGFSLLTLRMKYDDGFAAWINGVELMRANSPLEDLDWNSSAPMSHAASGFESVALGIATNLLQAGTNILAIQGLNVAADDDSFLILPELQGTLLMGEDTSGLYFTDPTPGTENLGGASTLGPGIADAQHAPSMPGETDNLTVTAKVFPTVRAVLSVTLHYRVMFNSEASLAMLDDGAHGDGEAGDGVYGATIPAHVSSSSEMVRYRITAQDVNAILSRLPVFSDPASTAEYFGTVINSGYVTSSLPIVHLFAPSSVLQPGPTTSQTGADSKEKDGGGGRVSLYYDGEFYDNVFMQLRGNTTANYNKKSHRLKFNREHPFRYSDTAKRIRRTSFVADYPDPTYMRQRLSYWLCNETGATGPFYSPFRLQLNGAFYQLANHNDLHGEELLERLGYDPNGALYNAAGTIQPNQSSTGGFTKKTREWEDNADYTALANAISESRATSERRMALFDRLDLPQVISYVVAARLVHENDDVWANMSLYHDNDGDDLWRIIPFDVNLSWGAAWMDSPAYSGIQVDNDNLKSFPLYGGSQSIPQGSGNWNRLYDVLYAVPETREMVLRRMRTLLDTYFMPPGTPSASVPVEQKVVEWRDQITEEAQLDRDWWGWPSKGGQSNFDPGIELADGVDDLLNNYIGKRRTHLYVKHSITNTALPIGISRNDNAGIPLPQSSSAVVSITGFEYNPASGNQDEEYVQLSNANSFAVDISDWELDGGIRFKFQKGTVIPAGGTLFVSPNTRAFRNRAASPRGGEGRFVVGPYGGRLNAWGESLTLVDPTARLVSSNSFAGNPSSAQRYLRIAEIMYNPSSLLTVTNDEQQFEYIELKNISTSVTLDLTGVHFTNGIYFDFASSAVTSLLPQQTVLLVRSPEAFTARWGNGATIAGQFTSLLDNGGETLRLEDAAGEKILEFAYNDTWHPTTDGLGFSLVIVDEHAPWQAWSQKTNWRASGALNGSPGVPDSSPPDISSVIVNEVLTHTDLPQLDAVELYNLTTNAVNIGGWFLTDDFYAPRKYRIANGTTISAKGYLVFDESQFNTGLNPFRFSEHGEFVYLFSGDSNTNLSGYYYGYEFGEAPNGVSLGRHSNSQGTVRFVLQSALTLNASNAYPRVGPIVVSEIMYRPLETNGVNNESDEFIELQNITGGNVLLYDSGNPTNTWRLRNAVDFDFPMGETLNAGKRLLVVSFDPTNTAQLNAFKSKYSVSGSVPVYGPWQGKLDNSDETIELKQPGSPDETQFVPYYMIDKVAYQDDAPWPTGADGIGNSLQRVSNTGYGNDPTNWFAAGVTAGEATVPNLAPTVEITSPTNGAVIVSSNGVTVSVVADDSDGSLALVQLFADDTELGSWTAASTDFVWSTAPSGSHTLTVRATDNLGAVAESEPVTFYLSATAPPTVALLAPVDGSILVEGSTIILSASATSGGGPAQTVTYYLDGNLIGGVGTPFNLPWMAAAPGSHILSVVATDSEQQTSAPDSVAVFVQAASVDPTPVAANSTWKYLDDGSDQGTGWTNLTFNDSSWSEGFGQLGYGDGDEATVISYGGDSNNKHTTCYFRRKFVIPSLAGITSAELSVLRDDGAIAYLNGVEVYRDNMTSGQVDYQTYSLDGVTGGDEATYHDTNLSLSGLRVGTNILAVEIHQTSSTSSDVSFDARLALQGSWYGPAITSQPVSQSVAAGEDVTFTVSSLGTAPLSYQWWFNDTTVGTSTSLALNNVQAGSAGSYYAVVANDFGVATSSIVNLTVTGTNPDTDGDGMPNAWEAVNGTNPSIADDEVDLDRDFLSNLEEYLAGTSPTNAASVLRFESMTMNGSDAVFSFSAISNRSYTVQKGPLAGPWLDWSNVNAAPNNRTIWLTNTLNGSEQYYRVFTPALP